MTALLGQALDKRLRIDARSFERLQRMIYERSGIFIAEGKAYLLEDRLAGRLRACGCRSFEEYDHLLRYDPRGRDEAARMIECITTNETYFFREPAHLEALRDEILPELGRRKRRLGDPRIRIWSAACSTGEEPYTLSITVEAAGAALAGCAVEILASDINEAVLASARRGVYGENSLRHVPPDVLRRYFTEEPGGRRRINDEVRRRVQFARLNLVEPERLRIASGSDVIFCKNVLIYFDRAAKRRVAETLYDLLRPGGYLFLGQAEFLHDVSRAFTPVQVGRSLVYRKE